MSALAISSARQPGAGLRDLLAQMRESEPRFFALGLLLLIAMVPTAFAMSIDQRIFLDVNVWDKPLKFEFALAIYILTLTFFARWLAPELAGRRWYRVYSGTVVAAIVAEMVWIAGAAGMAIPSHFNETPLGVVIYGFMGASAVLLTSASAVYAVQIARNSQTGLSPVLRESFVLGLGLVLPLTLITAGTMSSMGGHWIGGSPSDAGGLALLGWARDGGDLRVAHFFATHSLHVIPVVGLLSAGLLGGDRMGPMRLSAALYVLLVTYAFVQALSGHPFLPMLG